MGSMCVRAITISICLLFLPPPPSLSLILTLAPHRDKLVALGKASRLSAAVVFLPQYTLHFGKHGSDQCYCTAMYGSVKPWGCKVRTAVPATSR